MLDSDYEILKKNIQIKNLTTAIESLVEQIKSESIDSSHAARAICNLATDLLQISTELYQIKRFSEVLECEKISG